MKTVYLHIGNLKTGSSSIQNFLWEHRNVIFPAKYLNTGLIKREKHIGVRHYKLYKNIENERWLEAMANEIHSFTGENVIISYEGFVRFGIEKILLLKKWLHAFNVKIIFYVRRQDRFLESLYLEYLKNHRWSQVFDEFVSDQRFSRLCEYNMIASLWADCFGEKNVVVKNYESNVDHNNLLPDFLKLTNINTLKHTAQLKRHNKSLDVSSARFLISFNNSELARKSELKSCREVARRLIGMEAEKKGGGTPVFFDDEERQCILSKYERSNQDLFGRFNCEPFSSVIHSKEKTEISPNPELIQHLNALSVLV